MVETVSIGVSAQPVPPGEWREAVPPIGFEKLKAMVSRWSDQMQEALLQAQVDQDFYDSIQWTAEERTVLKDREQPIIVANRIKPAVNGIVGIVERGRTDPKAWPRTPNDEDSAGLATDVLRYVADKSRLQQLKSAALTENLIWGWSGCLVEVTSKGDTVPKRIRPESLIWDPTSRERDGTDGSFFGIGLWRFTGDISAENPDIPEDLISSATEAGAGGIPETMEDRPDGFTPVWGIDGQRRVFQVELYYKYRGEWWRCVFLRNMVLSDGPSPYVDEDGAPRCPIEIVRCYLDRWNRPYGVVRDMRDPQREVNMRRSRLIHELATTQAMIEDGAVPDVAEFRRQLNKSDGIPVANPGAISSGKIQIIDRGQKAQFQGELLAEAKNEIERQGPNPGVLGRETGDKSGRAILAIQQAGMMELAQVLGWFDDFILRIYRQVWRCMQQYGTAEDFVRITDDAGAPQFRQTWEPVPMPAPANDGMMTPDGQPMPPQMQMRNRLAELDVDLVLDTQPDVAVLAQEQFQEIGEALPIIAQLSPQLLPAFLRLWITNSSLKDKKQLLDALGQGSQPDPAQQAQMQLALADAQAKIRKTMADAAQSEAKVGQVQAQTVKTKAETAGIVLDHARHEDGDSDADRDRMMQLRQMDHQRTLAERERQTTGGR